MFPKHFDGKLFYNPDAPQAPGLLTALRWKLTSRPQPSPCFISDVEPSRPPRRMENSGLRTTVVNHSTVLLQQRGCNILTDPIWSERASPLAWIGPRRRRKPGVSWEDLPGIDAVLISHNHYDHLDLPTLHRLAARGDSTFIVPARHFSSRGIFDRNLTLWCGYVIESQERLVYFAGDTAFGNHFTQVREKFGSPHLALLPIGAYEPRWFMSPVHMNPEEAVRAHKILGAKTSIAIHHGTFQLADEGPDTPKKQLSACEHHEPFLVLNNGQFIDIP